MTVRRRSTLLLASFAAMAIAVGFLAALLKPAPVDPQSASAGLSFPAAPSEQPPDAQTFRAALVERLIAQARTESEPRRLPLFQSASASCVRDLTACTSLLARLREPDVPFSLRHEFARALPPGVEAEADALLLPGLGSLDPAHALDALTSLLARRRALVESEAACGCLFGLVPHNAPPGAPVFLFALAPEGQTLTWSPTEGDGWAVLQVARSTEGSRLLLRPWVMPSSPAEIRATPDGPSAQARQ